MGEPSKKQADQGVKRTDKGQFAPGQSGNPKGRPRGAASKALQLLRSWTLTKGLPALIEQAENGDQDALRLLVSLGLPRVKPQAAPIDGIQGLPRPKSFADLGKVSAAIYEFVARGVLSLEEAEALMKLADQVVKDINKGKWTKSPFNGAEEDPFELLQNADFSALEMPDVNMDIPDIAPVDTVKITAKRSFKEQ